MNKVARIIVLMFSLLVITPIFAVQPQKISNTQELSLMVRAPGEEEAIARREWEIMRGRTIQQYLHDEYINDFFRAAATGDIRTLKMRLRGDGEQTPVSVNEADRGTTALMVAATSGQVAAVEYLLTVPMINVNLKDSLGRTALMRAVYAGNKDVVAVLLKDQRIDIDTGYNDKTNALSIAISKGYTDIADMLRAAGAKE